MDRALVLVAGWVGQAFALWLAALRERLEKLREENDLLRRRLERIDPHRRPFYPPGNASGSSSTAD